MAVTTIGEASGGRSGQAPAMQPKPPSGPNTGAPGNIIADTAGVADRGQAYLDAIAKALQKALANKCFEREQSLLSRLAGAVKSAVTELLADGEKAMTELAPAYRGPTADAQIFALSSYVASKGISVGRSVGHIYQSVILNLWFEYPRLVTAFNLAGIVDDKLRAGQMKRAKEWLDGVIVVWVESGVLPQNTSGLTGEQKARLAPAALNDATKARRDALVARFDEFTAYMALQLIRSYRMPPTGNSGQGAKRSKQRAVIDMAWVRQRMSEVQVDTFRDPFVKVAGSVGMIETDIEQILFYAHLIKRSWQSRIVNDLSDESLRRLRRNGQQQLHDYIAIFIRGMERERNDGNADISELAHYLPNLNVRIDIEIQLFIKLFAINIPVIGTLLQFVNFFISTIDLMVWKERAEELANAEAMLEASVLSSEVAAGLERIVFLRREECIEQFAADAVASVATLTDPFGVFDKIPKSAAAIAAFLASVRRQAWIETDLAAVNQLLAKNGGAGVNLLLLRQFPFVAAQLPPSVPVDFPGVVPSGALALLKRKMDSGMPGLMKELPVQYWLEGADTLDLASAKSYPVETRDAFEKLCAIAKSCRAVTEIRLATDRS